MVAHSALITVMEKAARKAAPRLRRDFNEVDALQVSRKGPADFVTNADRAAEAAIAAGAEHVGYEDLIKRVQEGFTDFDSAIASPDAMTEVRKIARVLGPRGLMPNPKTGTVTDDTAKAVREVKAGRVDFKLDKNGNVSGSIGKSSFEPAQLEENARAFVDSVVRAKPATAKGNYIQAVTLAASMLPGIPLEAATYTKASS